MTEPRSRMRGRRPGGRRRRGYIVTLELLIILTIVVIGSLGACAFVRNQLVSLRDIRRSLDRQIFDSTAPTRFFIGTPTTYNTCGEPQVLCFVRTFDGADPPPDEGVAALVGVRPDRFTSRDRVYYNGNGCTGTEYLAPANESFPGTYSATAAAPPPLRPTSFFHALQHYRTSFGIGTPPDGVSFGVGAPGNWPGCTFGAGGTCSPGRLLRSAVPSPAGANVCVCSVWTSENPDCFSFTRNQVEVAAHPVTGDNSTFTDAGHLHTHAVTTAPGVTGPALPAPVSHTHTHTWMQTSGPEAVIQFDPLTRSLTSPNAICSNVDATAAVAAGFTPCVGAGLCGGVLIPLVAAASVDVIGAPGTNILDRYTPPFVIPAAATMTGTAPASPEAATAMPPGSPGTPLDVTRPATSETP